MYVKRIVIAGPVRETKKMDTIRANTKKVSRSANQTETSEKQRKINERSAEERLRWKINANFGYGDLHVVLHYRDQERDLENSFRDLARFKRRLHVLCSRAGAKVKYIATTETIGKNDVANIHHHIVLNRIDPELIQSAWEWVSEGWMSYTPLDRRGNHAKLAHYLMKQSRKTMGMAGRRIRRFSCSRGMIMPEPIYQRVSATAWLEEPRPTKGWMLWKDDNGETVRTGIHEAGWPWQEYTEVKTEFLNSWEKRKGNYVKQNHIDWPVNCRAGT